MLEKERVKEKERAKESVHVCVCEKERKGETEREGGNVTQQTYSKGTTDSQQLHRAQQSKSSVRW